MFCSNHFACTLQLTRRRTINVSFYFKFTTQKPSNNCLYCLNKLGKIYGIERLYCTHFLEISKQQMFVLFKWFREKKLTKLKVCIQITWRKPINKSLYCLNDLGKTYEIEICNVLNDLWKKNYYLKIFKNVDVVQI